MWPMDLVLGCAAWYMYASAFVGIGFECGIKPLNKKNSLFHLVLCCVVLYFFLAGFCAQRNKFGLCTCDTQQLHLQTTSQWKSMTNHKRIWPGPADFFADVHKIYRLWNIVPDLLQRSRICKYEAVFAQVRLRTCPNFLSWRQEMEEGRTVTKIWLNPFGYPQAQPEAINNGCVWQSRGLYTSCALLSIKMMLLSVTVAGARSAVLKINVCCCRSCCAESKCK